MTLQDLVKKIADEMKLSQNQARELIHKVCEGIAEGLVKEGGVRLGALGSFEVKVRKARVSRNPRTNARLFIPRKQAVAFRASAELKEQVAKRVVAATADGGVETQQDLDNAHETANAFLLEAHTKNADLGKRLHSSLYSWHASAHGASAFPQEQEKVAEAIRAELGGDFAHYTIHAQNWELIPGGVRFKAALEADGSSREVNLDLTKEHGTWKLSTISKK
jgi:DNA-binding protein HU-beta/integration host factor subunit alpha